MERVGIMWSSGIETVTIGYPSTLTFKKSLKISVTVQEPNVVPLEKAARVRFTPELQSAGSL